MTLATSSQPSSATTPSPTGAVTAPPDWPDLDLRVELLRVHALTNVVSAIEGFGDKIGETRRKALDQLVTALAEQACYKDFGRYAYAMPCGGGKTQAAVATIAAAYVVAPDLAFAMCANTIRALCLFKRDLMRAGVPEEMIGLRHSKSPAELREDLAGEDIPDEATRNTGGEDRPIMLVSYSHIKGPDGELFSKHKGEPRSLLIWDEALLASEAGFVQLLDVQTSALRLARELEQTPALKGFIDSALSGVSAADEALRRGDPSTVLDLMAGHDWAAVRREALLLRTRGGSGMRGESAKCVQALVGLAERDASVARIGDGEDAIIHYIVRVSEQWRNIAVLDASHSVSRLAQAGDVENRTTKEMLNCRTYEDVTVIQHKVAAGKSTQVCGGKNAREGARLAARLIADTPSCQRILIVTFKDTMRLVRGILAEEGVDLRRKIGDDPRVSFLTWGQETSTNAFVGCECVIFVGAFRMNRAQVVASLAGEAKDVLHRRPDPEVDLVMRAEMARAIHQGLHRGSCRVSESGGRARRMTAHIIDKEPGIRDLLVGSLPGVNWPEAERPASTLPGPTQEAIGAMTAYLRALPKSVLRIKSAAIKAQVAAGLGKDAWRRVVRTVAVGSMFNGIAGEDDWRQDGHYLARCAVGKTAGAL